jgi:hypothetical protein
MAPTKGAVRSSGTRSLAFKQGDAVKLPRSVSHVSVLCYLAHGYIIPSLDHIIRCATCQFFERCRIVCVFSSESFLPLKVEIGNARRRPLRRMQACWAIGWEATD